MKLKALPLAVAAAIAAPGVALADGPSVYGRLNVSYEMVDVDLGDNADFDTWQLFSNSSRVGVRGDAAINDSLKALYQVEWGVSADGDSSEMSQRDRFVGLGGDFGTIQVGMFDSPLKKAQGKVDLFNDIGGDIQHILLGENRLKDLIQYSTPKMGNIQANIAFQPGEEPDADLDIPGYDAKDGPADAFSASVVFDADGLYGAVAYDSEVTSAPAVGVSSTGGIVTFLSVIEDIADGLVDGAVLTEDEAEALVDYYSSRMRYDTLRLVGQYKMDALQFGAIYQMSESSDEFFGYDAEQDGFVLSAGYTMGANLFKVQYGASTLELSGDDGSADIDAEQLSVGVDHSLTKQTVVFAYFSTLDYEGEGDAEQSRDNLGVGIIHNF